MHKVVIIGTGQVGQTLGRLLNHSNKYKVIGVWDRKLSNARAAVRFIGRGARIYKDKAEAVRPADIVFITTPDDAIENVCCEIFSARQTYSDKTVIHCSGSQPADILKSAQRHRNVYIASFHPMQTFADKSETARNFKGTYCVYEGQPRALAGVRRIINALGGIPVEIKARNKMLYHIGCVFASNYLVTLIGGAREFLKRCGFRDKDILKSIQPLINSTLKNVRTMGIAPALTGPVSRGDVLTVNSHIKALRKSQPLYTALYRELGRQTIRIALKKGTVTPAQADLLKEAMSV